MGDIPPRDPLDTITPGTSLQLSPAGDVVAALGIGEVIFWDTSSGTISSRTVYLSEDTGFTSPRPWSWKGPVIAVADWRDGVVTANIVDASTGAPISDVVVESDGRAVSPWSLALSPDGHLLASSLGDGTIRIHSTTDGSEISRVTPRDAEVSESGEHVPDPSYTDDGLLVLSSGFVQCPVQFWNTDGSRLLRVMSETARPYHHFQHTPDGSLFVLFRIVDPKGPTMAVELRDGTTFELVHEHPVPTVPFVTALHPAGTHVAWCARGRSDERSVIHVMDLETAAITELRGHTHAPSSLVYSQDGATLLSMDSRDGIRAWDHTTATLAKVFDRPA